MLTNTLNALNNHSSSSFFGFLKKKKTTTTTTIRVCLVSEFKLTFSYFKQHYTLIGK